TVLPIVNTSPGATKTSTNRNAETSASNSSTTAWATKSTKSRRSSTSAARRPAKRLRRAPSMPECSAILEFDGRRHHHEARIMNTAEQDTGNETTMLQQITRLRDEIRVKLNLAGKDVRDLWENLEPKVHD